MIEATFVMAFLIGCVWVLVGIAVLGMMEDAGFDPQRDLPAPGPVFFLLMICWPLAAAWVWWKRYHR